MSRLNMLHAADITDEEYIAVLDGVVSAMTRQFGDRQALRLAHDVNQADDMGQMMSSLRQLTQHLLRMPLGLSDEQKAKIESVRDKAFDADRSLAEAREEARTS